MRQKDKVLEYMKNRGSISSIEAFHIGITRLAARIYDLRRDGERIASERVFYVAGDGTKKHYDRYRLVGGVDG